MPDHRTKVWNEYKIFPSSPAQSNHETPIDEFSELYLFVHLNRKRLRWLSYAKGDSKDFSHYEILPHSISRRRGFLTLLACLSFAKDHHEDELTFSSALLWSDNAIGPLSVATDTRFFLSTPFSLQSFAWLSPLRL